MLLNIRTDKKETKLHCVVQGLKPRKTKVNRSIPLWPPFQLSLGSFLP